MFNKQEWIKTIIIFILGCCVNSILLMVFITPGNRNVSYNTTARYNKYDMELIMAHIMEYIHLPENEIERLDVNVDGYITSLDYVLIRDVTEAYNE